MQMVEHAKSAEQDKEEAAIKWYVKRGWCGMNLGGVRM